MSPSNKNLKQIVRDCFLRPTAFYGFGGKTKIQYIVCFDENGTSSELKYFEEAINSGMEINQDRRYFTLTGCLYDETQFQNAVYLLKQLKKQFWPNSHETVLLHSRDIRRCLGPFNMKGPKREKFLNSLSNTLSMVDCTVFSMTFDLLEYVKANKKHNPYAVAFDWLTERVLKKTKGERVAYIFESRGKKEDEELLEHAKKLLYRTGTKNNTKDELKSSIRGVFFNKKSASEDFKNVYPGIEIADLFSYPIHRFARYGTEGKDFVIVKTKIYGYPRIKGRGYVIFPNQGKTKGGH